ncbi:MAG: ROK family protein [Oscillospiraceae bacterium]|nr:ROK family protein [Oscillospiraceae bacterium]
MFIGIDIGGTKCAVVKGDSVCGVVDKIKFDTTDLEDTLKNIFDATAKIGMADAIGISCGGPLDSKKGIIMSPPNLPGWDNVPICNMLRERFGIPVALQNDANACALAEWKYGAGKGSENMIFLTFGTGLGAGLILNGRLYSGTNDMAGEVGHIRLSGFGPVGYGKSGSFEGFCSGGGIARLGKMIAEEKLQRGETTAFCSTYDELDKINAKLIAECAKQGDEAALEVYNICAEKLGAGISVLIDILNPECVVIGSIFQRSEEILRKRMETVIDKEALLYSKKVCRIVPAKLGDSIGDWAAIAVAETFYKEVIENE